MSHRLLRLLFGAGLLLLCSNPFAAAGNAHLAHLHQLQLDLQGSLGDFYLLYGVDADPQYNLSIERRLDVAELHLGRLGHGPATPALADLRQQWQAYRQQLDELRGSLTRQEEPDGSAIAELIRRNEQLMATCASLAGALAREQAPASAPLVAHSQTLELQLQSLSTRYIAYNIGANTLGGDGPAIDQLAGQFAAGLAALSAAAPPAGEYRRLLDSIRAKWRYIEPALRNYQETAIPALVSRYSARIIEDLARLQLASQASP